VRQPCRAPRRHPRRRGGHRRRCSGWSLAGTPCSRWPASCRLRAAGRWPRRLEPGASPVGAVVTASSRRGRAPDPARGCCASPPARTRTRRTRVVPTPTTPAHSRRSFLVAAAGAGVGAVVTAGRRPVALGGRIGCSSTRAASPLPARPGRCPPRRPHSGGRPRRGSRPVLTPTSRFFRIDTALRVPQVDPDTWELRSTGWSTARWCSPTTSCSRCPLEEVDLTLQCVSNEVGGDLVGNARWTGVRLATCSSQPGIRPQAEQVVGRPSTGSTPGSPSSAVTDGRDAIVAVAMNGEPLPTRHGFPARLVVPGLYGYVSATKWLAEIELTTWEGFDGYWVPRGWSKEGPIKTSSRIDVPRPGAELDAGRTVVAGVAWAPTRGVAARRGTGRRRPVGPRRSSPRPCRGHLGAVACRGRPARRRTLRARPRGRRRGGAATRGPAAAGAGRGRGVAPSGRADALSRAGGALHRWTVAARCANLARRSRAPRGSRSSHVSRLWAILVLAALSGACAASPAPPIPRSCAW
jgi:DMSO/TMAO reductase YedYZ molybdopterin-dependent catalytic subunit